MAGLGMKQEKQYCADCGKEIDVTKDTYWASTNLICDSCYQSYPIQDED